MIRTARLSLRLFTVEDAPFLLTLANDPDWLRYIGDRGIRTLAHAQDYLVNGPIASYLKHGSGLFLVERSADGVPIGMCGLIRRDALDDVDLGFAYLPEYRGMGFAHEAAAATLAHARGTLGLARVVAIVSPANASSIRLLEKLGMSFERRMTLAEGANEVCLFGTKG